MGGVNPGRGSLFRPYLESFPYRCFRIIGMANVDALLVSAVIFNMEIKRHSGEEYGIGGHGAILV
jgi:hypothetical protein